MAANTTTLSTLIKPLVADQPSVPKFTNRHFLSTFTAMGCPEVMAMGDTAFRWKVLRGTGNSSVGTFAEGDAVPAAGSQSWIEASLSYALGSFWVRAQVSGFAADAMGSAYLGQEWTSAASGYGEIKAAVDDLTDQINNTFMGAGSGTAGLQNAIDDGGTYSALARGTYTDWQCAITDGGGDALSMADMNNNQELLFDNDRGAGPLSGTVMAVSQAFNYKSLAGAENGTAANRLVRYTVDVTGGVPKFDAGMVPGAGTDTGLSFGGAPIYGVPDAPDQLVYLVTDVPRNFLIATIRPLTVEDLAKTDDSRIDKLISTRLLWMCLNPRHQGRIENITA